LDHPQQEKDGGWSCGLRIAEGDQVIVDDEALGADALQAIVSAIAGLRWHFQQRRFHADTSWFDDEPGTGLPIYLPQGLGREFDRRLRELVDSEVRERTRELELEDARRRSGAR
jgi:hypothetical protein